MDLGGVSLLGDPWLDGALLLVVGVVAGLVNAMAGGGSFLSLPLLIALGLPPRMANGTIRVAVLAQTLTSSLTFHRHGVRTHELTLKLAVPVMAGAGAGSLLATQIDDAIFRPLIGVLMLVWAALLLFKPDRFLSPPDEERDPTVLTYVFASLVGIYGGFLQAGVGFPLIALLTAHLGYDLVRSNAVKVTLIFAYTCLALPVFALAGQVVWIPALVLAAGTMLGSWAGARWQVEKGSGVVRWFVLVTVTVAGLFMLRPLIVPE